MLNKMNTNTITIAIPFEVDSFSSLKLRDYYRLLHDRCYWIRLIGNTDRTKRDHRYPGE